MFIDELHTIVGAGKAEGSMDAGCARSSRCWPPANCTASVPPPSMNTANTSKKTRPSNAAFSRFLSNSQMSPTPYRFCAASKNVSVFHGVKIRDRSLVAASVLSHRYISDRFLPDKAIDLVDEACAMIRTDIESMPASSTKSPAASCGSIGGPDQRERRTEPRPP